MNTLQEVLDACTIEGNKVFLPKVQLDRKLYSEVNKKLTAIGGKWNRSAKAHIFPSDPSELFGRVKEGEDINLKKDYQFFATPPDIADWLVEISEIKPNDKVLEPSAGQGAIIDAILKAVGPREIHAIELMAQNCDVMVEKYLTAKVRLLLMQGIDFLKIKGITFDKIIANPPFSKNQDIDHIRHMYDLLSSDGRLVSICSNHPWISSNKKETEFVQWLEDINAQITELDKGSFKDSGTMVGAKIIIIDKF